MDALITYKRRAIAACVALVVLLLSTGAFASTAEAGLNFILSVEPASLTAPGAVTVSARVSNAGSEDITVPLSLKDPDGKLVTSFGDGGSLFPLKSGQSIPWQGEYKVSQKQLDEGKLIYTLHYNKTDAQGNIVEHSLPATATIAFADAKVALKVARTITPEVVRRDGEVKIIYDLSNQGNVTLTHINLKENRLISNKTQTVDSLAPGESKQITFSKKSPPGDLTSSAQITYRKEGERTTQKATVAPVQIPLAKPALNYTLNADKQQVSIGETVTLKLILRNAGNISYDNVSVTDPVLGEVFSNLSIPAGQTLEKTKEVIINQSTTFKFTLNLQDNTGVTKQETVPEFKVSAYAEGQMLRLNLVLTANKEAVSAIPGDITFNLVVTNDSNNTAKNIKIKHGAADIYTINELAPGQSITVSRDFQISQAGKFRFSAVATDVQNTQMTFESNTLDIGYVAPTPAPTKEVIITPAPLVTHSPLPQDYGQEGSGGIRNALFIATLGIGVLFALFLALFVISSIMRARARAKSNAAYDSFEVSTTRDYTAPPTEAPVEKPEETPDPANEAPQEKTEKITLPHEKYLAQMEEVPKADVAPSAPPPKAEEGGSSYRLTREESTDIKPEPPAEKTPAETEDAEPRKRRASRRKDSDA
jgi:hypothetical protein